MPFWTPNHFQSTYSQLFDSLNFSRAHRVTAIAAFQSHTHVNSPSQQSPSQSAHVLWFVKVVCTLCIRYSNSRYVSCSDYLRKNLNPLIAFDVIKHININFRNPLLALNFLQFTKLNLNLIHSLQTYSFLLRSFCEAGFHDSAKLVLDYMKSDGYALDNSLAEFLVISFANANKFELAKDLLLAQSKSNIMSAFVYNNFFNLMIKKNRTDEAVSLFRNQVLTLKCCFPDTCTFNIILRGLCKVGQLDDAFGVFKDMESFKCLPDLVTYNTLINGFCRIGSVDRAHNLLEEVKLKDSCLPDVVTYTSIISGYCKLGKMDVALNLFDEMTRFRIKPNPFTFNTLINGFGKSGDMVSAMEMYKKIFHFGFHADVITFTSLIDGHCRMQQLDEGLKLFDEMKSRNLSPNLYTFSILINTLCKENRLKEARNILTLLNSRTDILAQPFIYNPVIDGFCKSGNIDEANVIVKEMEEIKRCKPDKLTFTILILGHCMKGKMLDAISIFNKMIKDGCAPDSITVNSLISCLIKAGMPNEAHKIKQTALVGVNSDVLSTESQAKLDIRVAV